jgi:hypothetical protein
MSIHSIHAPNIWNSDAATLDYKVYKSSHEYKWDDE